MRLVAYMITKAPRSTSKNMRDALESAKSIISCDITGSLCGDTYLTVTLSDQNIDRKLCFVKSEGQVPPNSTAFIMFDDALAWAMGKNKTTTPSVRQPFEGYSWSIDQIAKWVPSIRRIEQNVKKGDVYTTVIWSDGSKPTVVKKSEDDPHDPYFAVASAIAIKVYGSNSAFRREIAEKFELRNRVYSIEHCSTSKYRRLRELEEMKKNGDQ